MSLCDWPGRVCAVLFLGGCDLRCPTCHNAQLAWMPESLPIFVREDLLECLLRVAPWLDGLVVTGGEACLSEDLPEWLAELRSAFSLPVKLDTNGMHPEVLERCLRRDAVDTVAVDVKGPWDKYPLLTGNRVGPEQAAACLEKVFHLAGEFAGRFLFRCTLVPQLDPKDVDRIRDLLPAGFSLCTQQFSKPRKRPGESQSC